MIKKALIMGVSALILQGTVSAILPPLYHTLAEFKAVIESPELTKALQSGEAILSITREDSTKFTVLTNKHKLSIDIVYEPTARMGPAKFHLDFHEPAPLTQ